MGIRRLQSTHSQPRPSVSNLPRLWPPPPCFLPVLVGCGCHGPCTDPQSTPQALSSSLRLTLGLGILSWESLPGLGATCLQKPPKLMTSRLGGSVRDGGTQEKDKQGSYPSGHVTDLPASPRGSSYSSGVRRGSSSQDLYLVPTESTPAPVPCTSQKRDVL